jgi:hypothetical protein
MKQITFADRLRYQFDNLMAKGTIALPQPGRRLCGSGPTTQFLHGSRSGQTAWRDSYRLPPAGFG